MNWSTENIKETLRTWSLELRQDHVKEFEHSGSREQSWRVKKGVKCNLYFNKIIELQLYNAFLIISYPVYITSCKECTQYSPLQNQIYTLIYQSLRYCGAIVRLFKINTEYLNLWASWTSNSWNLGLPHFFQREELHQTQLLTATRSPDNWQLSFSEYTYKNWHLTHPH